MGMISVRAAVQVANAGRPLARLRAIRDGNAALRVAAAHAALRLGVLGELRQETSPRRLADGLGLPDVALLDAFLRVLTAHGLVTTRNGRSRLTRHGTAILDDAVVRAAYEAFGGFHGDVYRTLPDLLRGSRRRDVVENAETIASLSSAMEPLVRATLAAEVRAADPVRVLDVGCGDGSLLRHLLDLAPRAHGTGVEVDAGTASRARSALAAAGLAERATVAHGDVRDLLRSGALDGPVGLVLLANVLYYVPPGERAGLLSLLAGLLAPGGRLVVLSTVADGSVFSRHFDLLLRAQDPPMALPTVDDITRVLSAAGLEVVRNRRVAPGDPLHVVTGERRRAASRGASGPRAHPT